MSNPAVVLKISALDQTKEAFSNLKKNVEAANDSAAKSSVSFGSMAKAMATVAGAYFSIERAYSAVQLGVRVAADLETAEIGLKTLLGSGEKAAETIARLKVEAARTPFELPGLTQATQLLTSVTKDGNKSIDILLNVGEALAAMGKGQAELDRLIVNLQQVAATGKAASIDIKQFAFAGIPIYEMLAETTGKTGDELEKLIAEGGITFDVLTRMFDEANNEGGRFFNAFVNQSGSFNQAAANMKDSFGLMMADIVQSSGLFQGLTDSMIQVSAVMANWRGVVEGIREGFGSLLDDIDARTGLITHIQYAFQAVAAVFQATLKPAIDEFMAALEPLAPLGQALITVFGGGLLVALHLIIAAITGLTTAVALALTMLTNMAGFIAEVFTFTIDALSSSIMAVSQVFESVWAASIETVRSAVETLTDWLENLIDKFERAIELAKELGGGALGFVKRILPGRASGGSVMSGQPYMVGERGPELFVPSGAGRIIPNYALAGASSATNINLTITGNSFMGEEDMVEKVGNKLIGIVKQNMRL